MVNIKYIDVGSMTQKEACAVIDGVKGLDVGTTYKDITSFTKPIFYGIIFVLLIQFVVQIVPLFIN